MASGGEPFYLNPTFWVGGSFAVFVGGVLYKKADHAIRDMIDARIETIKAQLAEAKTLREDAEELLTDYQRRQRDAESEAKDIFARAEADAKLLLEQNAADIAAMSERRVAAAEAKISQAEAQAVKQVRAAAVTAAVEATKDLLASKLPAKSAKALVDTAIKDVAARVH